MKKEIVANKEDEFSGIYLAHCLDERIEVEVGNQVGILTRYEPWKPTFPAKFAAPGAERFPERVLSNAGCLPFLIRFIGTPGEAEICGYQGCCRRRVTVRQVLELKEAPGGVG